MLPSRCRTHGWAGAGFFESPKVVLRLADCKSAIQQVKNLRYPGGLPSQRLFADEPAESETKAASAPSDPAPRSSVHAAGPAAASSTISTPELDRAIQEVVHERKYTWRMPREKVVEEETSQDGILSRFLERVGALFQRWAESFGRWLDYWLRKLFQNQRQTTPYSSGYQWMVTQQVLVFALVTAAVAGLTLLVYRLWQERRRAATRTIASEAIQPAPDLTDENVGADHLPEDGWTKLARELLERGELRPALRAFYLSSLAHLAQRNLLSLAKFKSNHDYERELRRRGHSLPELPALFGENVLVFERVWYGMHALDREMVSQFAANVERMRSGQ
jgi:hypothetical protein